MNFTEEQKDEFEKLTKQVMKFLCDNFHPHVSVIVDPTHAEILEGQAATVTHEFVKD